MITNDRHDTTNDPIIPALPTFGALAGGRSYLRREAPGRVIHMTGGKNPIILDPYTRDGEPFDASRFLREMANDLLGPGVIAHDGDKLTDSELDALDAALDEDNA